MDTDFIKYIKYFISINHHDLHTFILSNGYIKYLTIVLNTSNNYNNPFKLKYLKISIYILYFIILYNYTDHKPIKLLLSFLYDLDNCNKDNYTFIILKYAHLFHNFILFLFGMVYAQEIYKNLNFDIPFNTFIKKLIISL